MGKSLCDLCGGEISIGGKKKSINIKFPPACKFECPLANNLLKMTQPGGTNVEAWR